MPKTGVDQAPRQALSETCGPDGAQNMRVVAKTGRKLWVPRRCGCDAGRGDTPAAVRAINRSLTEPIRAPRATLAFAALALGSATAQLAPGRTLFPFTAHAVAPELVVLHPPMPNRDGSFPLLQVP